MVSALLTERSCITSVYQSHSHTHMWQQWTNVILGLWIVALPFAGFTLDTLDGLLVLTGLVIGALALWGAIYERSDMHRHEMQFTSG